MEKQVFSSFRRISSFTKCWLWSSGKLANISCGSCFLHSIILHVVAQSICLHNLWWLFPDGVCGAQNCASLELNILVVHIWPVRGAIVVTWSLFQMHERVNLQNSVWHFSLKSPTLIRWNADRSLQRVFVSVSFASFFDCFPSVYTGFYGHEKLSVYKPRISFVRFHTK